MYLGFGEGEEAEARRGPANKGPTPGSDNYNLNYSFTFFPFAAKCTLGPINLRPSVDPCHKIHAGLGSRTSLLPP